MAQPPHPYTWKTSHLRQLEESARGLGKDKAPTDEEVAAFIETLPKTFPHIASATHDKAQHRINVTLHGGLLAFPVALRAE